MVVIAHGCLFHSDYVCFWLFILSIQRALYGMIRLDMMVLRHPSFTWAVSPWPGYRSRLLHSFVRVDHFARNGGRQVMDQEGNVDSDE